MSRSVPLIGLCLLLAGGLVVLAEPFHRIEMGSIRLYQRFGSPLMGYFVTCRFRPTCSAYALHTLQEDGFWVGNLRIGVRLIHCSPIGGLLSVLSP